jgi:hypothetical protein
VRSALCLAAEGGFPVTEEVRSRQPVGETGLSEQWLRAVLIDQGRLDEDALEVVRGAASHGPPEARPAGTDPLADMVGRPAPALELHDATGSTRRLSDSAGHVVVVHFWAPWLSLSTQTLASLRDLRPELDAGDIELLPVVAEEDATRLLGVARAVLEEIDPSAPFLAPDPAGLAGFHANEFLPVTAIVNREGVVRKVFVGSTGTAALRDSIRDIAGP